VNDKPSPFEGQPVDLDDIPFADGIDPDIADKIIEIANATGGHVDRHGVARDCRCPIPFCDAPRMRVRPGRTQPLLWCDECGQRREGRKHSKHLAQALFRKHGIRIGRPKGLPPIPKAALKLPEPARSAYLWLDKLFRFIGPRANDSLPMLWDWLESGRCDDLGSRLCEALSLGCPIPANLLKLGFAIPRRAIRAVLKTLVGSGLVRLFKVRGRNIRGKPYLNKFGLAAMPGADGSAPTYVEPDEELEEGFEGVEEAGNTEVAGCYYTTPTCRRVQGFPYPPPMSVDTPARYSRNPTSQNVEISLEGLPASSEGSPALCAGSTGPPTATRSGCFEGERDQETADEQRQKAAGRLRRGMAQALGLAGLKARKEALDWAEFRAWRAAQAKATPRCGYGCKNGCVNGFGAGCSVSGFICV
jgi:hypothetical protein